MNAFTRSVSLVAVFAFAVHARPATSSECWAGWAFATPTLGAVVRWLLETISNDRFIGHAGFDCACNLLPTAPLTSTLGRETCSFLC